MDFPSPIAFYIFSHPVRWYGIAYAIGTVLAWRWGVFLLKSHIFFLCHRVLADFLMMIMPAIIIGGRLGYVVLYAPSYFLKYPLEIFSVWKGGMAFHGAVLTCALVSWWFCRRRNISWLSLTDCLLCGAPLGLFLGRIANFLNQELYGIPWKYGVIFPNVDSTARHPSQLYEAFSEGLGLFIVLNLLAFKTGLPRSKGALSGCFLIGYSITRWVCEYTREPDLLPWFEYNMISAGQAYSLPMLGVGIYLLVRTSSPGWCTKKIA
ncbi:prolipoprotein diacylglyceryl transferase [Holospora curviuscula]|uniref:Phosphatidylglycerol--prolipoprotein diacylglyceryl transferase n=1 Tax=Holospora curviuscula TaxID=1082868 RepID=A0A2S5R7D8_9PROT|nr:prolipoprotein diacylglyceryl transferase [Holospora curviuscula]PPE03224.1 Prolipoprotein diacylglyceryl transferase [Holospora curviuscula]